MTHGTRLRRAFFPWAALTCALIAVIGFRRSYYLKSLFATAPLPPSLHVHGVIMSWWCLLFGVQLISLQRTVCVYTGTSEFCGPNAEDSRHGVAFQVHNLLILRLLSAEAPRYHG